MDIRKITFGAAALLGLVACEVDVTEEGRLPDVDVTADAGKLPEVDVRGPKVEIGKKQVDVSVPDVDVSMDEKEMTVPTIGVELPAEKD